MTANWLSNDGSLKIMKSLINQEFYAVYCDGNCKWKVLKQIGVDVYLCEIDKAELDYGGAQKSFLGSEIRGAIQFAESFKEMQTDHDIAYAALKQGDIVHYHNGFGTYVRCLAMFNDKEKEMQLLPVALVGKWMKHDLPQRRADGSIYQSYYPKRIAEQELMRPNASNIYEFSQDLQKRRQDPRKMEPIDLSVPDITPEQAEMATLWQAVNNARNALSEGTSPKEMIKQAFDILNHEEVRRLS